MVDLAAGVHRGWSKNLLGGHLSIGCSLPAVVSRTRAFTIAAAWVVAGLAAGIAAFAATTGVPTDGIRSVVTAALLFLPACLIVAGVWVGVGARQARSAASLGGQAALFGLAAALVAVLLLAALGPALGDAAH
jgi:hypothetical protein